MALRYVFLCVDGVAAGQGRGRYAMGNAATGGSRCVRQQFPGRGWHGYTAFGLGLNTEHDTRRG